MASKYFIVVRPGSAAFDVEDLVKRLRAQYPSMEDDETDEVGNRHWRIADSGWTAVRGKFDADGESLTLEGALASIAPVAISIRDIVPSSVSLDMCDEEYTWNTELAQSMGPDDLLAME